jgi:hypothetical protein
VAQVFGTYNPQVQPQAPGQQPGQGGEHGTISPVGPRVRYLTPQHRDLMPEDQDLHVLDGVASHQQSQPAEHPDHEEIDQTNEHESRA